MTSDDLEKARPRDGRGEGPITGQVRGGGVDAEGVGRKERGVEHIGLERVTWGRY